MDSAVAFSTKTDRSCAFRLYLFCTHYYVPPYYFTTNRTRFSSARAPPYRVLQNIRNLTSIAARDMVFYCSSGAVLTRPQKKRKTLSSIVFFVFIFVALIYTYYIIFPSETTRDRRLYSPDPSGQNADAPANACQYTRTITITITRDVLSREYAFLSHSDADDSYAGARVCLTSS